jgi:hypothetical protein
MDSLPPEAARDKEVWRHYGVKSALNFPLSAGGQLFGALTFNTVREERPWQSPSALNEPVGASKDQEALAPRWGSSPQRSTAACRSWVFQFTVRRPLTAELPNSSHRRLPAASGKP